jgi:serine/threonine-protein kinase
MKNIVGRILLDQYRVETFIAAGGMGSVFKVYDQKRNVHLAMKVLHGDLAEDPVVLRRFRREARALQDLSHPNIVPFYGLFQDAGYTFFLEAFIDGPTLKEIFRQRGNQPFTLPETLGYIQPLASALGYAHNHKLVHCDLKPGNIMVAPGGTIYLTDFGVVRHADATVTSLGFAGTPSYMAPEQVRGEIVSPATDIYALAILAYEMLAGRRPFTGEEDGLGDDDTTTRNERLRHAQLRLKPPEPSTFNPDIPDNSEQAIMQALEKDPKKRFNNVQSFYQALSSGVAVEPVQAAVPEGIDGSNLQPIPIQPIIVPAPQEETPWYRKPAAMVLGGAGFMAALIFLISSLGNGGPEAAAIPPTAFDQPSGEDATNGDNDAPYPTNTSRPAVQSTDTRQPAAQPTNNSAPTPLPPISHSGEPEGRIVFTCYIDNFDQICIVNADGSNYRQLTDEEAGSYYPSLAPNGNRIVFSSNRVDRYEIYEMDDDGSDVDRLTDEIASGNYAPMISPDGRQIVFTGYVRDVSQSIWIMDRDGSDLRYLTDDAADDVNPVWSPDGSQISFASFRTSDGQRQIFVMDADGSDMYQLTDRDEMGASSSWSPDGRWIAFHAGPSDNRQIYIIGTDGSGLRQVTDDGGDNLAPCFTADGEWIIYASYLDGDLELFAIRPDGSGRQQITHNDYSDYQPRCEP